MGAVMTIALWGLAGLAAYFVFVVAVGKWLALEFPEPADLDVEHPRLRVVRDDLSDDEWWRP